MPTHGYEATREAAMAAFAKSWAVGNSVALITCPILRQPLSQAAPLQHGRKALHRRRPTLLRSLYRAISRRSYDQLGAHKPVLAPARPLCFGKDRRPRQPLHDLPPMVDCGLADHDEILPLMTAISWQTYETLTHNECWRERARLRWRRSLRAGGGQRERHHFWARRNAALRSMLKSHKPGLRAKISRCCCSLIQHTAAF